MSKIAKELESVLSGLEGRTDAERAATYLTQVATDQHGVMGIDRWRLLPYLFRVKGKPYSLDNYPQFRELFAKTIPPNEVIMAGRQISKSTSFSRSEVSMLIQIPQFQMIYVAPLASQAIRYSTLYLTEAIQSCKPAQWLQDRGSMHMMPKNLRGDIEIKKSVLHHTFLNGASIQLTYAKSDSDRARGIMADLMDFDEIQDQSIDNLNIISESGTSSEYNCRRFAGTAKTVDNTLETLWQKSSKGEWTVKCKSCNYWNIPDLDHDVLSMIRPHGPSCAKCGRRINVREGEVIHQRPHLVNVFRGLHIPQIVVPAITESPRKWTALLSKVADQPPSTVLNEILGISCDIGTRLITQLDIDKASNLGTYEQLYANRHQYAHRCLGIDWGIAEVTSFTVGTVLGITVSGDIHVLFAKKYVGQNPEETIEDLTRIYYMYNCDFCAPDFGVGYVNNNMLANRGLAVVQCQYVSQNKFLSVAPAHGVTKWTVDRNTALSVVFHNIRSGRIRFPNNEVIGHITADLLSPYETLVESSSGMMTKKFLRAPDKADDFCHALTFGCLVLWKAADHAVLSVTPEHAGVRSKGNEKDMTAEEGVFEAASLNEVDAEASIASLGDMHSGDYTMM